MRTLIVIITHTRSSSPRGKIFPRKLHEICQAAPHPDAEIIILYAVLNQNLASYSTQLFSKESVEASSITTAELETTINSLLAPEFMPTLTLYLDGNLGNPGDHDFSALAKQHAQQIAYNRLSVFTETPQLLEKALTQAIAPGSYADDAIATRDLLAHIKQLVIDAVPDLNQDTLPSNIHSRTECDQLADEVSGSATPMPAVNMAQQPTPLLFRLFPCCQPRKQVIPNEAAPGGITLA